MSQVRVAGHAKKLLNEIITERKANHNLIISKQAIVVELIMNEHKKVFAKKGRG